MLKHIVELTFIVLARPDRYPCASHLLLSTDQIKDCKMIGDVNLFLPDGPAHDVECEIMIAGEPSSPVMTEA